MSLFQFLVQYYPILFVWISGITILVVYRHSWPLSFKILAIFLLLYALSDTAGSIMAAFYKLKNHYIYNIVYGIQFIVISFFFYCQLDSRYMKKVILCFFFLFPLSVLISMIWFDGIYTLQTFNYVFGGIFVIIISLAYLLQLYAGEETQSIFRDPVFWFSLAWLINFSVTVPFFGMLNYLIYNFPALALSYYLLVVDITDCLRSVLLTIGFLFTRVGAKSIA